MGLEPSSWPALKYRDQLPPAARQEFESLVAQIITFLSRQHAEDGSHVDVTGATLTLTGAGAIGTRARLITPGSSTIPTTTNVLRDGAADGPRYTVYRLAPTANATVQTIYAKDSDALAGQLLVLINTSAFTVTLKHRFSGGIGDITNPGSADYVITANASVVLWFDRTTRTFWVIATVGGTASGGDVVGPASSVDNEIALYSGVTGKLIKRATGTGLVHATSGVYSVGTAAYSDIQNVSATSQFLGRKTAGAGVIEELSVSDALTLLGFTNAGASIYTGTGHPQGVTAAPLGSQYIDTATGYVYRKVGGASTVYGWYLDMSNAGAGQMGPMGFTLFYSGLTAATGGLRMNGYGYFMTAVADAVDMFTATAVTTFGHSFVSGKLFKTITSAATNNLSMYEAASTNPRQALDDDLDLWFEVRTAADITSVRFWAGITNAVITDSDTFATGGQGALLFRYSTAAPDGGWIGQTSKNGAANHSETATVAAIAANTTYKLRIRYVVAAGTPTAYFSVNDGTELSLTTNLPPTGQTYFPIFGLTCKAAAAHTIGLRAIAGWQGS